ncbi:MAG: hypothetical protein KIT87_19375 [Anaerolineae bacterium]|nr:hypothetical protein [Anaerolineae bacterium]
MLEIAELTAQGTLKLPAEIASHFRPQDRFVVWVEGDSLLFKLITRPSIVDLVAEAPEGQPMTLDEINDLVHEVRQQRHKG